MNNFQRMAAPLFIAARAGRGGGLLLLPFFLLILVIFWIIARLGSLLFRSALCLASSVDLVKAGQRWQ